jgi:hypothetical protein
MRLLYVVHQQPYKTTGETKDKGRMKLEVLLTF